MIPGDNGKTQAGGRDRLPFRLHDVEVRPASNELLASGRVVRVKPRLMEVLLRLAATPGEVVTRETLLADAWPRRMVNDEVLSRAIADLRDALGDDAREARFIETLPKVGYRLIAPVTAAAPAPPTAATAVAPPAPPSARRASGFPAWRIALGLAAALALTLLVVLRPGSQAANPRAALERQLAQAEPFSSDPLLELSPRFSPDGARVAFAVGEGARWQIVIRDVNSPARATLGDAADANLSPVFFPDGKRIAYLRRRPSGECAIVAQDLASGAEQVLVGCARRPQARFDLAPDGRHLVYTGVVRAQFPAGLLLHEIATGSERVLTAPEPDLGDDRYPRFSPDGTRVVFFRGTESHRQAWLVDIAAGSSARNLDSPRGLSYGAAWLGRDGPLLIAADWFGQRALNLLDLRAGSAVTVGARGARFPDAAPNGDIVFENAVYSANLFELDPARADATPRERWPSTRYTNQAEYSPDGRRVLFISNRDGASAIFVADVDGTPRRLLPPDDWSYLRPHWSLDGRAVYAVRASRRGDGSRQQQGVRIAVPDGGIEILAALGNDVSDVREIDDGKRLIVGEAAGSATRLLRTARDGTQSERLALPLVGEFAVANGRLAFTQPQLIGLTLCELASQKCEPLPVPIDEDNRFDWLLTADAVWYTTNAAPRELVRFDLAQRAPIWRSAFAPTALGLSIAVAPDGRAVLVAREAPPAIDLLLARPAR